MKKAIVFYDGKFVAAGEKGIINPFDPGFLYGYGVFETMRSYNEKIFRFYDHYHRLRQATSRLGIELRDSAGYLQRMAESTIKKNRLLNAYIRLNCWQGAKRSHTLIFVKKLPRYSCKGFKAIVSEYRHNEYSALAGIKSLNYSNFYLARRNAEAKGFDEAILLNTKGNIVEGTRSNIFFVFNKKLFTPSLSCGCLSGVTRKVVLELARKERIAVKETNILPRALHNADEVLVTNSLLEIMPVTRIGKKKINKGVPGEITRLLSQRYRTLTKL
ncbi:aminotransferase class IV [Candidatus Omnitrophota bacterium]